MTERIEFKETVTADPVTNKKQNAVAVIRDGQQVALVGDGDRLKRALSLTLKDVEYIVNNFARIMNREPTPNEREFWRALLDFKRGQS